MLYYTISSESVSLNLLTYREADADGFYLLLAAPKVEIDETEVVRKRIIFGLDISGSMRGEKFEQARAALRYVLNHLNAGDEFNIVSYATAVEQFSREGAVPASAEQLIAALDYVDKLEVGGGTNIDGSLKAALSGARDDELTNILLFLTDGMPTIGETDTEKILENVRNADTNEVRIFSFGVGFDVNTHLLDRLAADNQGFSMYVEPNEDIEIEVSAFYNKISNPVLSGLLLDYGVVEVYDVYPEVLPDLFLESQIVQLGRYRGSGGGLVLTGEVNGEIQTFSQDVSFTAFDRTNEFIPRLWATRKIGYLLDQIRLNGEDQELVEEIVALSKRYGIITPYTSFLILEDDMPAPGTFDDLIKNQTGEAAVKSSEAVRGYGGAATTDDVQSSEVRYVGDKTFFLREGYWKDSIVGEEPTLDYLFGSDDYFSLVMSKPGLGRYLSLGKNVIVRYEGVTYRIGKYLVDVEEEEQDPKPSDFGLEQNYPNPFNASTVIRFSVQSERHQLVQLVVYDLLGRRVRTLVSNRLNSGTYERVWDGRDDFGHLMASGLYLYRLTVGRGEWIHGRKMVLIR